MKTGLTITLTALFTATFVLSCSNGNTTADEQKTDEKTAQVNIKEEAVSYTLDSFTAKSFLAYDDSKQDKRPAVLVVPEWWGLNDYVRNRAKQLAGIGYIAMAVDMYGEGKTAADPGEAQKLATPFYQNPQLTKIRLDAALNKLRENALTDTANIAAIGYCYGGYVVLNAAKLGADLNGVVSFHGSLAGVAPNKDLLKAAVLVCHGAADNFVSNQEVSAFRKGMDSIGADYTFEVYPDATHAFTNPQATEVGKKFNMPIAYNAAADTASWTDMKIFFGKIFTTNPE